MWIQSDLHLQRREASNLADEQSTDAPKRSPHRPKHLKPERIKIDDKTITLLGTIAGLSSERKEIKRIFNKVKPEAVAVSLSPEDIESLNAEEISMPMDEEIYLRKLAMYGEVRVPAPSYLTAYHLCEAKAVPIHPLLMNDAEYAECFMKHVTSLQLIRQALRYKRLRRKRFRQDEPDAFARAFDAQINALKGYKRLKAELESSMATRLLALEHTEILAIIDIRMIDGLKRHLSSHRAEMA